MAYKNFHRFTGIVISLFVVVHLFNHTMAWFGIATHQKILEAFRIVYHQPIIEVLLVGCFLFQAYSGIKLINALRKKANYSTYEKIQIYSGIVLGLFIIQHISATIGQRMYYGFDTNFYFASRVVLANPMKFYFIPYYFLGVMAFATHLANVHQNKIVSATGIKKANIHFGAILLFFVLIVCLILYVFMGGRYEIVIPNEYNVY